MRTKSKLIQLQIEALQLGATKATVIPISSISIDERVRLKCLIPLCDKYNRHLMCPPHLPPIEEFRKCLKKYSKALFVQLSLAKTGKISKAEIRRYGLRLHQIINQLERRALFLGYPLSAGLIGGSCKLCRECVGPAGPCRRPLLSRPSMEGMGIDVIYTAKRIGLPFDFSSKNRLFWNGLVLIE